MSDSGMFESTLAGRLAVVAAEAGYIQKTGFNAHFKYKFVSEASVKAEVSPALRKAGLAVVGVNHVLLPGSTFTDAVVSTQVVIGGVGLHETASFTGLGSGSDKGDKAVMKAQAAGLKYALTSAFLIATGDDPEADATPDAPANKAEAPEVTADLLTQRILTAPNADALATLKPAVIAFQAKDEAVYQTLVAAYRARNDALKKDGVK